MIRNAIGLIETIGLAAAVEAADVAVKSANVKLIGYELAKGDGMTTVKVEGDVGAVKAAVESAKAAASLVGKVYSVQVIPRPAQGLEHLIYSKDTVGLEKEEPKPEPEPPKPEEPKKEVEKPEPEPAAPPAAEEKAPEPKPQEVKKEQEKQEPEKKEPPKPAEEKKPVQKKTTPKPPQKPAGEGKKEGE